MAERLSRLATLIVDNELGSRMRLKEATVVLPVFSQVIPAGSLKEAGDYLRDGETNFNLIFVSHHFEREAALTLIRDGKTSKRGQDAAYVLLATSIEGSNMAENLMAGFDGILSEPYSINSLNDMVELATRVRGERTAAREKLAMHLLLKDLTQQLDVVAYLKRSGFETNKSLATLKEMASNLGGISEDSRKSLQDVAAKIFGECAPPQYAAETKKYVGVSKRVRNRMANKIMSVIESGKGDALGLPSCPGKPAEKK